MSLWAPMALVLLALVICVAVARAAVPTRAGAAALAGLAGLWLWATLSSAWAESADQAMLDANRWLLYAAFFAVLLSLLRDDRLSVLLIVAVTIGIAAFAAYLCVRLVLPGSAELFLGGRLNYPLGYVNGQAGYLLLGAWPLVALAERGRPAFAGPALGAATVLAGLVLLAQTRAVIPAVLIAAAVLVVALPGRQRRCWALLAIGAGVAAASGALLDVYGEAGPSGTPDEQTVRTAIVVLLVASMVVASAWTLLRAAIERQRSPVARRRLRVASGTALVAIPVVVAVTVLASVGNPIREAGDELRAFKRLDVHSTNESSSRFASGGGNRYDYWRIAVAQLRDEPVVGVGAGNYDTTYFARRRTVEDVRQPHSLPLQALAELGLVGGIALALFVGGVLAGLARRMRAAAHSHRDLGLAVSCGGVFLVWLAHTSVDWLHLIPGITGIALCAAAVLVAPLRPAGTARRPWTRTALVAGASIVAFAGSVLVGSAALAERHVDLAQRAIASDPLHALDEADEALSLNDEALPAYYARAAAYARLDDYPQAQATLLEAAAREPSDFVTWGLLGDLAARRGYLEQAQAAYRRASRLNPRDLSLRRLAREAPRR